MAEYSRIIAAAHAHYSRKLARETVQKRLLLALLKKHGRFKFNMGGNAYEWRVRYKEHAFSGVDDLEVLEWSREDTYKRPSLGWREVVTKDVISRREVKLVQGPEQILAIYDEKMETLKSDFASGFSKYLFEDGEASGNTKLFHGLESVLADDDASADSDKFADPNDTYASLTTGLGDYGNASGDPGYGFFSPRLENSGYNGSSWAVSGDETLRRCILNTSFGNSSELMPTFALFNKTAYEELLNLADSKERIMIKKGEENDVTRLGFKAFEFDGLPCSWDFNVPDTYSNPSSKTVNGYLINVYALSLIFAGKQLEDGRTLDKAKDMAELRAHLLLLRGLLVSRGWGGEFLLEVEDDRHQKREDVDRLELGVDEVEVELDRPLGDADEVVGL